MKTMTKALSLILAVMMLLSVCSFSVMAEETASVTLTDIDSTSAVGKAVNRLVSMGIINGYPDGTFRPDNTITRAEFCVVMVKFEGVQNNINPDAMTGFEDLDMDENYAWVRPYVAMAVSRGIINGFEDGTFRAADPVTYEQAIKMIMCSLGYSKTASTPTIAGDWSSGYIAKALRIGVTSGTSISNKTMATTRGIVAILTSNALDAPRETATELGVEIIMPDDNTMGNLGYEEITGIVTGTYITELEYEKSSVPKNHIQIDDEIYEIGFSTSPYAFLGAKVNAMVKTNEDGDYPVVTSLELARKSSVVTVEAGLVGDYDDGVLQYLKKRGATKWEEAKIEDEYIVIFNEKLDEDYDISNLKEDLENGTVDLIDNDGDSKVEVIRVNSYEVFVVASKSTSTQKITLMYDKTYEGSTSFAFPEDSTSLLFTLTRNGKEIAFKDIAKWDVLNIKASDEDAAGRRYYEVVVTRNSISGSVEERDASDESYIVVKGEELRIADSYLELVAEAHEDAVDLEVGDNVQVYLDCFGNVVAAAKSSTGDSSEAYAYMFGLRQDADESDYDLEFWLYTTAGKELKIGSAAKITIDGKKYKALDEKAVDYLEETAELANKYYADADNVVYQQPIIYQTNSEGLVSVIYTVNSMENSDISAVMNVDGGDTYFVESDQRQYKSSSKSFTDFKVSSSTKIIFVPDNRADTDEYLTFSSYSKAFSNGRDYYVEAYGLSSSKTASLVLLYSQNDSRIYTYSSPWMIVASKSTTASGTVVKGYTGTSYSLKSVTVDEEDGPSIASIGKGDIIRYIVDTDGEMIDYQIWFDASDPAQLQSFSDIDDAIESRILEIHSTSTEARKNYPSAAFRLQFGTVYEIILDEDGTIEEETITVVPTIAEDGMEMVNDGDGVVDRTIGSSVKVFSYDATSRNSNVVTEADLSEVLDYATYENDATRVITYSASGTLRMVYIITIEAE